MSRSTTHAQGELIVGAQKNTTVGGAAVESFSFPSAKAGQAALALIETQGAVPVIVEAAKVDVDGEVEVTFDADPAADHVVSLFVFRLA